MNVKNRKYIRLNGFDYSNDGVYFLTVCVKDRKCILSQIVGDGVLDVPNIKLSDYGKIAENQIFSMNKTYKHITVEKYVIMPNHIHLLVRIGASKYSGTSRTPSPTNSEIAKFISTFKRFCNKQYGKNIWQRAYFDHIVRDENEYISCLEYVENNSLKWNKDKYYEEV